MAPFPRPKPQKVRCKAVSKHTGEPCKKWAVHGALVCEQHGAGGTPETSVVVRKARERVDEAQRLLFALYQPAVDAVREILENPQARAQDRLKAAETVLDRMIPKRVESTEVRADERDLDRELEEVLGLPPEGEATMEETG